MDRVRSFALTLAVALAAGSPAFASAPALPAAEPRAATPVRSALPTPETASAALEDLAARFPGHVRIERIGTSALGRPLWIARLGKPTKEPRPTVFALFGQHPDEHDMTTLGITLTRQLADRYGRDARVTALIDHAEVVTMPMANPDGSAYELQEAPAPFIWRRNRRPHVHGVGTNLNRNWGGTWRPGEPSDWTGSAPFSEPETRAVRDWLQARARVAALFDFHSGTSGFNQGIVLVPEPHEIPGHLRQRHVEHADGMARRMTWPADRREGYWALASSQVRDKLITAMRRHVPEPHRAGAIASVPTDTRVYGTTIAWSAQALGAVSLGLEISRPFDHNAPEAYAAALAADYTGRAPRITDAFVETATAILAPSAAL